MNKFGSQDGKEENQGTLVEKYVDLEYKLASCLQHHRLAAFKPRILALALISLELEKQQAQEPEMNIDWLASITYLQQLAKVNEVERTLFQPKKKFDLFFLRVKVESDALLSCRDLIVRLSPTYKVVRLELADLAFISRAYNSSSSLKPLISLPDRPTYADVVCGRVAPAAQ